MARSVRSFDCSPETVDSRIDSGVSIASRSSTFELPEPVGSRVDWIVSAFACASVTFSSESSMNFLRTNYNYMSNARPLR